MSRWIGGCVAMLALVVAGADAAQTRAQVDAQITRLQGDMNKKDLDLAQAEQDLQKTKELLAILERECKRIEELFAPFRDRVEGQRRTLQAAYDQYMEIYNKRYESEMLPGNVPAPKDEGGRVAPTRREPAWNRHEREEGRIRWYIFGDDPRTYGQWGQMLVDQEKVLETARGAFWKIKDQVDKDIRGGDWTDFGLVRDYESLARAVDAKLQEKVSASQHKTTLENTTIPALTSALAVLRSRLDLLLEERRKLNSVAIATGPTTATVPSTRPVAVVPPVAPPTSRPVPTVKIKVERPDAGELAGNVNMYNSYCMQLVARFTAPVAGQYVSLRIHLDNGGDRYLWAKVRPGQNEHRFSGTFPVPKGPFVLTLSCPQSPLVAETKIRGTMALGGSAPTASAMDAGLKALQTRKQKLEDVRSKPDAKPSDIRYQQRAMAGDLALLADKFNGLGNHAEGLKLLGQAMGVLRQAGLADELPKGYQTLGIDVDRAGIMEASFTMHYQSADAANVRAIGDELVGLYTAGAEKAQDKSGKNSLYRGVAITYATMVERLLVLGALDGPAAVRMWDQGVPFWLKTGVAAEDLPYPNWHPANKRQ